MGNVGPMLVKITRVIIVYEYYTGHLRLYIIIMTLIEHNKALWSAYVLMYCGLILYWDEGNKS